MNLTLFDRGDRFVFWGGFIGTVTVLCRGQKFFRLSVIASTANERHCIWREANNLTFTFLFSAEPE